MRYFIDYIIDFEMSNIQKKLVIKAGVDPQLDERELYIFYILYIYKNFINDQWSLY